MRIIGRFFYYLVVLGMSLLSLGIIVVHIFEPQLQEQFLKGLRPYVKADLEVGFVSASLFENFPMASVELKQVQIGETYDSSRANAYEVGSIFILFDYNDIFSGKWRAKQIVLENATVKMEVNERGETNYDFWPSDSSDSDTVGVSFDLDQVEVRNCQYSFSNLRSGFAFSTFIESGSFSLHSTSGRTEMDVQANFNIQDLRSGELSILENKNLKSKLGFTIQDGDVYSVEAGLLEIEGMQFQVDGTVDNSGEYVVTDLDVEGTQTELRDMMALSPGLLQGSLDDYEIAGGSFFNAKFRGPWTPTKSAGMLIGFGIRDGVIAQKSSGLKFDGINLEGSYSNGKGRTNSSSTLSLRNIKASESQKKISGAFVLSDFDHPYLDFAVKADVDLNRIHALFSLPAISSITGGLKADVQFKGKLRDLESAETIERTDFSGDVRLQELEILVEGDQESWKSVNGNLNFEKPYLLLNEVSGNKSFSDFAVDGYVKNPFGFIAGKEKLSLMVDVSSKHLRIEDFIGETDTTARSEKSGEMEHWPDYLTMSANLDVNVLQWDDLRADQVTGRLKYSPSHLEFEKVSLNAMGGRIEATGMVHELLPAGYDVVGTISSDSIDVATLFADADNFGQDYITHKHLKGQLATQMNLSFETDDDFDIMSRTFVADANVTITRGELIGFLPMMKIGNFMKVGHFEHIVLDTLSNHFFVKDELIHVPKMDIHSNTLDMTLSGTHSFDNVVDYHVKVNVKKLFMSQHKLNPANFMKFENDQGGGMTCSCW